MHMDCCHRFSFRWTRGLTCKRWRLHATIEAGVAALAATLAAALEKGGPCAGATCGAMLQQGPGIKQQKTSGAALGV